MMFLNACTVHQLLSLFQSSLHIKEITSGKRLVQFSPEIYLLKEITTIEVLHFPAVEYDRNFTLL